MICSPGRKVDVNQWFYLYHFKLGQKLHKLFQGSSAEPLMMNDQEMQEMATVVKRAKKLAEVREILMQYP